jgi:hypothetical protein
MKKNKNDNEDNELKEAITISNNLEKIINNRNNGKSRNNFSELSSLKTFLKNNATSTNDNYGTTVSIYNTPRCPEYKTFFKRTKKDKNKHLYYKETEKDKINNKLEAEKRTQELLSFKTKKDIKSYYIKKDYARTIADNEKEGNKSIDPMTYIKFNLANDPKNNNLFRSLDTQLMVMGNLKYRNDLLEGVNMYKNKIAKYDDLRGPVGYDKDQIEEKKRYKILQKMKNYFVGRRGLVFSNKLYKNKNNKIYCNFEFDEKYKNFKKLLYENMDKYERRTQRKKIKGKSFDVDIDKNDIKTLRNIDSNAAFVITDKEEMVKFTNRFLSFDNKMNRILNKTRNTTNFLFLRAKEHQQIKRKIDQLYKNIEESTNMILK